MHHNNIRKKTGYLHDQAAKRASTELPRVGCVWMWWCMRGACLGWVLTNTTDQLLKWVLWRGTCLEESVPNTTIDQYRKTQQHHPHHPSTTPHQTQNQTGTDALPHTTHTTTNKQKRLPAPVGLQLLLLLARGSNGHLPLPPRPLLLLPGAVLAGTWWDVGDVG